MDSAALYQLALRYLTQRAHSVFELKQKLLKKTQEAQLIQVVFEKLQDLELLNDQRFAELYTAMRLRRGFGPLRIEQELKQRGLSAENIFTALALHAGQWTTRAKEVRSKKFGRQLPKNLLEKARQQRFLQQRGFALDQIRKVWENECDDESADE